MGIRVAWNECPDRGEGYDGVHDGSQHDNYADNCHKEACLCEMDVEQMLV